MPWQVPVEVVEHTTLGTSFLPGLAGVLPPAGGGGGGGGPPSPGMGGGGGGGGGPDMAFARRVRQIGSLEEMEQLRSNGPRESECNRVPLNDN
jgi:hypothetical protein